MNGLPFPPNLKPSRKGGRLERVYVCPQCGHISFIIYEIDEIVHGIFTGLYNRTHKKDCFPRACPKCKHQYILKSSRSRCDACNKMVDCLLHGTAEVINRRVWKPYSTIFPRRLTVWE